MKDHCLHALTALGRALMATGLGLALAAQSTVAAAASSCAGTHDYTTCWCNQITVVPKDAFQRAASTADKLNPDNIVEYIFRVKNSFNLVQYSTPLTCKGACMMSEDGYGSCDGPMTDWGCLDSEGANLLFECTPIKPIKHGATGCKMNTHYRLCQVFSGKYVPQR